MLEFEAEQPATFAVFHAHDFGVDVAAGGANVLAHDSNRQLDFQVAIRDEGGGSQDQHADCADVEGGEKFLEGFAVGIDAVRKHRKREWQARPPAQFGNASRPHAMIVAQIAGRRYRKIGETVLTPGAPGTEVENRLRFVAFLLHWGWNRYIVHTFRCSPGVPTVFARIVELVATSDAAAEFVQILHEQVLPKIKVQTGCIAAFVELPSGGAMVMGLSLWESMSDAERFRQECYPEIEEMMLPFLKGKPTVRTIEVPELGKVVMHARAMAEKASPGSLHLR